MVKNSMQVRTLGAAEVPPFIYEDTRRIRRRGGCIKCCCCTAVVLLLLALAILVSTVFGLCRDPILQVGNITVGSLHQQLNHSSVTLNADVWVFNPNFASIYYGNMTTMLFYRGVVFGESHTPPGTATARRTVTINATVDIMTDRIMSQPDLDADMRSGLVNVSSDTRFGGEMDLGIFKKQMTMKMSCNVSINVTSKTIQQHKCKRKIKLWRD